ncbi:hypothetical protein Esti_000895 [Eimeria stiedai]
MLMLRLPTHPHTQVPAPKKPARLDRSPGADAYVMSCASLRYNMRRRSQQLQAVSFPEFQQKVALLQLARQYVEGEAPVEGSQEEVAQHGASEGAPGLTAATAAFYAAVRCNRKGTDHLKKHPHHQEVASSATPEGPQMEADPQADIKAAAAKAATATWKAALQQHPERCNLFEQMPPFASAARNLEYMNKAYGFFIPDEEFCTDPAGLVRRLWRHQQEQPSCLFCGRRFRGVRAALQHMQHRRHFQLGWDEQQRDLLAKFYDYRKSYYDLLERFPFKSTPQLTGPEVPTEAESRIVAAPVQTGLGEDASDWENCSSDEEDEADEQQKLEAMLRARGWRCARVTEDGVLQLPNGQDVLHRDHAVYLRQRFRRVEPRKAEQCVLQDLAWAPTLPVSSHFNSSGILLRKRQKLQVFVGHGGGVLQSRERQRLVLPLKEHRLLRQCEAEQQRELQEQHLKVSIKANKLQRAMLRETKCFL